MKLESLDFLYVPAPHIDASVTFYTDVLGGELVWKIHAFGVWVACIRFSNTEKPYILLADHINRNDVMQIYRVENLETAISDLRANGWRMEATIEIPPGPCATLRDPAGNAIVIYQNVRPYVMQEFKGRIDSARANKNSSTASESNKQTG